MRAGSRRLEQGELDSWLLHVCASGGTARDVRDALAEGADPNCKDAAGFAPLHRAAREGGAGKAEALLEAGARIDEPSRYGDTPLLLALGDGSEEAARLLIRRGANPEAEREDGYNALALAARRGGAELAMALLEAGAGRESRERALEALEAAGASLRAGMLRALIEASEMGERVAPGRRGGGPKGI